MDGRGITLSSLSEVSTRRRAGRAEEESWEDWAEELDREEKLPGGRGWEREGCILMDCVRVKMVAVTY